MVGEHSHVVLYAWQSVAFSVCSSTANIGKHVCGMGVQAEEAQELHAFMDGGEHAYDGFMTITTGNGASHAAKVAFGQYVGVPDIPFGRRLEHGIEQEAEGSVEHVYEPTAVVA